MTDRMPGHRQRGVALLITLWAMALLCLVMASIVSTVRLENRQSQYLLQHTRAQLMAEAGLAMAVQRLGSSQREQRRQVDGEPWRFEFDHARLSVEVHSELGKVDLNSAAPDLCARLAMLQGASANEAAQLAAALRTRQDDNDTVPLHVLEEVTQLPDMNAALFSRLEPYITVWSGYDQPIADLAAPVVREAMMQNTLGPSGETDPGQVVTVLSQAELDNGFRSTLSVTLSLNVTDGNAQPYRVLRWQQ